MGGRGTWSKPVGAGFAWHDYHKIFQEGDIHFLAQHDHNEGGNSSPVMSQTPNVIYATLGKSGEVAYISKYRNRKMEYQIDVNDHKGLYPHVHHCAANGYRKAKEPLKDMKLNDKEDDLYKKVIQIFESNKAEIQFCIGGGRR